MTRPISSLLYRIRVIFILVLFGALWKINTWDPHPVIVTVLDFLGENQGGTIRLAYLASMLLYAAGLWLRIAGASILGPETVWKGNPSARSLIESGVYQSIRHPIHLGSILILLSLLPLNSPPSAGIILFVAIPFILFLAYHEDQFLKDRFQDFPAYRQRVPGFIPRPGTLDRLIFPFDPGQPGRISSGIRSEFFNLSFLGGFAGFVWKGNTPAFWWGMALGAIITLLAFLFSTKQQPLRNS